MFEWLNKLVTPKKVDQSKNKTIVCDDGSIRLNLEHPEVQAAIEEHLIQLGRVQITKKQAQKVAPITDAEIDEIAAPWLCPDGHASASDVRAIVRAVLASPVTQRIQVG